ncbi:MAG: oxygen-dependent coproporphyrinogen oxidase [Bacteroidia bacterium]|nr:oxygen-dependent coproporphyrinogen oxidase [Bacteroidia bacterium]
MSLTKEEISEWFQGLQTRICRALEEVDGESKFESEIWERPGGGGGHTRVIRNGKVFEKGGVNYSAVWGATPEAILNALHLEESNFYATGVSIVIHPKSPKVPIIHMNVRYFEMSNGIWWFGGGIDLTPIYVIESDGQFFHQQLKNTCDQFHPDFYTQFKNWADDYFFIRHRKETRGIGGVFFDHLKETEQFSKEDRFQFIQAIGETFAPTYVELVNRHKHETYTEEEKQWQLLRRGRYVEFNLVYDKGTKFGLDTDGRIESILMSLPLFASWEYNHKVKSDSEEANTLAYLVKGKDWISS